MANVELFSVEGWGDSGPSNKLSFSFAGVLTLSKVIETSGVMLLLTGSDRQDSGFFDVSCIVILFWYISVCFCVALLTTYHIR